MKKILFTALSLLLIPALAIAQYRIEQPVLVGPADAATNQMTNVTLNWDAVINATGYQVMVGHDENFTNPEVDLFTPLSGYENIDLMFNQTYYWKVRAVEGEDFSNWTDPRSFTTFSAIDLYKPNDGNAGEKALIEFKWKSKVGGSSGTPLDGIDFYQLQVDTDETIFNNSNANPQWNIAIPEGVFKYKLSNLFYGETMYWRLRAYHANDTCAWSEVWSFETDNEIELDKPDNGSTKQGLNETMEWDEFDGTVEYDYQIHNNASFNGALNYFVDSTEVPTPQLRYGTLYYWHVRGKNLSDTTSWSEAWTFETAGEVDLDTPEDMADSISVNPVLKWIQITGTKSYHIQYSIDSTFAETVSVFMATNNNQTTPSFSIGTALNEGTEYFWRIRACSQNDTSNFSEVRSFTTLGVIGINEYLINDNVSLFPNPASTSSTLSISVAKPGTASYSLSDLTGQEIKAGALNLNIGTNNKTLDLKGISKGIYLINIKFENEILGKKLIIR